MGTGKGTTSNTVQNQNVQYTPYGLPNFNDIYSRAQQVSQTPYNPYTGELVAGLNGYQFGGINQIMDSAQQAQPYLGAAGNQIQGASGMTQNAYNQAGAGAPWIQNYGLNNIGQGAGMIASAQSPLQQGQQQILQGAGAIGAGQGYLPGAANAVNQGLGTIGQAPGYVGQGGNTINQGAGIAGSGIGNIGTGLSAMQQGLGTTGGAPGFIGAGGNYAFSGANGVGNIGAGDIAQYMNPYQQNVIQATLGNMAEDNAQQQQQVQGNAAMRGALGGDRVGVAQSELARQQALANNQTLAGLNAQNYQQATQTALTQQQNQQANQARQLQAAGLLGSLGSQFGQLGATQAGIGQGIAGTANQYGQLGATIGGLGQSYAGLGGLLSNIGQANFSGANALGGLGATQAGIGSQIAGAGNALVGSAGQQAGIGNLYAGTGLQYGNLAGQNASLAGQMGGLAGQYGSLGNQYGNIGLQAQGAGIQGGTSLLGAGTASQQNQQALDTANYQQYLQQLAFPYQQAQFMAGIGLPASGAMGGFQSQIGNANQVITPPGMSVPQGLIGGSALLGGLFGNGWGGTGAQGGRVDSFARGGETPDVDYRTIDELSGKSWIPEIKDINIPTSFHANMSMAPMSAIPQASNQSALGSVAGLAGLAGAGKSLASGISGLFGSGSTAGILGATGAEDAGLLAGAGVGAAADLGAAADVGAAAGVAGEASGLAAADLAPLLLLKRGGSVGYDEGGGVSYPAEQIGGNNPYSLQNIRGGIPRMQGIQTPKPFMGEFMSMHPPMDVAKAAAATPAITPEQMAKLGNMGSRMMTVEAEASGGRVPHYATGGQLAAAELQARGFDPFNRFPYPPPVPQHFPEPMDFSRHLRDPIPGSGTPGAPDIAPVAPGGIPGVIADTGGSGGGPGGAGDGGLGAGIGVGIGLGDSAGSPTTGGFPGWGGNTMGGFFDGAPDQGVPGNPSPSTPGTFGTPATPSPGLPDPGGLFNTGTPAQTANPTSTISITQDMASPAPESGMFNGSFGAIPGAPGFNNSGSLFGPSDMFGAPTATLAEQMGLDDINASPNNALNSNALDAISQALDNAAMSAIAQEASTPSPSPAPPGYTPGDMAAPDTSDAGSITGTGSAGLSGLGGMASGAFGGVGGVSQGGTSGLGGGVVGANAASEADASSGIGLGDASGTGTGQDASGSVAGVTGAAAASANATGDVGVGVGLGDAGVSGDASGAADASGAGIGVGADASGDGSGGDGGGGSGEKRGGYVRGYDEGGEVYGSDATVLDDGTVIDSPYPKPGGSTKGDFLGGLSPNDVVAQRWPQLGDTAPLPQSRPPAADVSGLPSNIEMQAGPYAAARQQAVDPGRASWGDIMNTRSPMYDNATPQRKSFMDVMGNPKDRSRALMEFGARVLAANPAHGWGAAIGQGALGTMGTFDKMSNEDLSARQKAQALAAKIKEHVDSYTQETAHQKRTSDLAEKRINQENMRPLGMTANNQPLLWDSKSGRIINGFTGQPPSAEDKMSSLGTRSGGTNPQMMRFQLAQQAYPDDPKKAAEVALGIRPPTDLQLDSYLVKNFPQLIGKSPQEIAAFREQFKLQSFPGAASGAKPMPTDKSQLEKDQVYQTPRGTARWDGEKFNPL